MINSVLLVGRLTKDVELRYSPQGTAMATVTIACQREFKNSNGERESDFIQVKAFRKTAELMANHFKKGEVLGVQGRIQTGSYEGQDGKRVYTTDVYADSLKFIQGNNRNNDSGQTGGAPTYGGQPTYNTQPTYDAPPQGAATQPQQQYSEAQVQEYLRQQQAQKQQQQQQPPQQQINYNRVDEDPFANSKGPIEVSEDDLPF